MKKSLLALAVLGSFAGAASAQSSVTLFGIVDAGYARVSGSGNHVQGLSNSGYNSSRLGFRGVEDLGGGLRAAFWLEGALSNDDGNAAGFNFRRRSTVALLGNFGEVRLGRDYAPSFWNLTVYDPFGTNGIGSNLAIGMLPSSLAQTTNNVRSDNSIGYFLPDNLGGFVGQVQVSFGENNSNGPKTNNYWGARFGYVAGPISTHFGYGKTEGGTATVNSNALDNKYMNFGFSYDLGVAKPMVLIAREKNGAGNRVTAWELGVSVPLGQSEIRAAYSRYNQESGTVAFNDADYNKIAIGYVYNLSKRTALYGTYARVSNDGAQVKAVTAAGLPSVLVNPGASSNGIELGIRHAF